MKQYKFSEHAINRLHEINLNEKEGLEMLKYARWYNPPANILLRKFFRSRNSLVAYKIYEYEEETILFTIDISGRKNYVITVTKK